MLFIYCYNFEIDESKTLQYSPTSIYAPSPPLSTELYVQST